ncbi:BMP family protein [Caloramator sp. ALD01]|uniref:BMP family lipoprotein n=1 Tax=Caloramator sp. ALD01 TaxID=1031288 RepID=UPI0004207A99|nr:BMP family ABC transporter substrate-binding protein [Caloramator sp. ALD01]
MKMKKALALVLSASLIAGVFTGCAKKGGEQGTQPKSNVKIGMVTDQGGLGDKSFNDSAYEGLKRIEKDFGVKPDVLQSKQQENYEPNLTQLGQRDDLTFAIGFLMEGSLKNVAQKMPDKKFAIIDAVVDLPNVMSITFKEEEGSFLMGVIAGKMTKTNKVGFIGGIDMPLIQKFEAGFAAGVKAVNPQAAEGLMNRTTVKYAGSFTDSNKGYELAKALYNDGCDVVYHASGAVGLGLFKAAKEMKKWAIGVDQDQAETAPDFKDVILSSMIKRVDVGTYTASKNLIEGNFKAGHMVLGLKEDGVGYAPTTKNNTPADVIALVDKYAQAIKDGKITVPEKLEDVKNFTAPEVK